jgi:copper chaperone CopZ
MLRSLSMSYRLFLVTMLIGILGIGCSVSNGKEANIALPTMMCGMCETNIKSSVADLDGVMKVNIDLEKKTGQVVFDEKKISVEQIEARIAGAGYKANSTAAVKSAYDNLPRCCKVNG